MKLRKLLPVVLSLSLILAACSNDSPQNTTATPGEGTGDPVPNETMITEPQSDQTVRFWSIYPEGDPNYDWTMDVLERFKADYPMITVEYTGISFWDYFTKITTSMSDRSGPDLFLQTIKDTSDRASGGISLNLTPFLDDEINRDSFYEEDLNPMTYEGNLYGIPYALDNRVLYYNVDLMDELKDLPDAAWTETKAAQKEGSTITEKPADLVDEEGHVRAPQTWDELHAYQELLTKRDGGKITQLGFDVGVGNMMFVNVVWNQGGDFFDAEGNPNLVGNPEVQAGYEIWNELATTFPTAQVNSLLSSAGENTTNLFWNKSVAMMVNTNEIPWMNDKLPEADRVNLGAAPIPYDNDEAKHFNFTGGFSLEIAARLADESVDKQVATWLLAKYLTSPEIQREVLLETSNMPGNVETYTTLLEEIEDPVKRLVLEEMEHRKPYDYIYNAPNWFGIVQDSVTDMVSGRHSVEDAIQRAQEGIERLQLTY